MNSKSDQSDPSADESIHEFPIDSCDHMISTSLRDLNKKYKDLSHEKLDSTDVNTKKN